ncbi:unnamed protein product [Peronospora belbahrii]|uniref:Uncharacterized protein n=1 Tax=Peronospora belbahrii TaxID=622444 RepID=A0AAU9KPP8_9STRA|nr:unnamed protein product [Peronospora belbahrii]CAH0518599.1 unnamed protein product [Peronospora belbahrii]
MSDSHPETWNPLWALEDTITTGSITTKKDKRAYAAASLQSNCKDKNFCTLFTDLVEMQRLMDKEKASEVTAEVSN